MSYRVVPVIMSGGVGSRLWPMSRRSKPKQLQALTGELTMLQETLSRVSEDTDKVQFVEPIIVANQSHGSVIAGQLTEVSVVDYTLVLEPEGRNTAPVVSIAAELTNGVEDTLILVLPADHHIVDEEGFRSAISQGANLASQGKLVTFGVQPTGPETGYGYIQAGKQTGPGFEVAAFVEKPNQQTAQVYLDEGNYFWNAGIFLFRADIVLAEMDEHCKEIALLSRDALAQSNHAGQTIELNKVLFSKCPSESFDYAVMEKTDRAVVVPLDVGWSDVGAWNALWDLAGKDDRGNVCLGDVTLFDTGNLYVRGEGIKVTALGVSDLVIVATKDAVIVMPTHRAQDVKVLVEALEREGRDDLL